jgi:hypothetical protein
MWKSDLLHLKNKPRRSEGMVTKSAIERRLSDLETKMKPKKIETLADWVRWIARRERFGDDGPMPELSPAMAELLEQMKTWGQENQDPLS